MLLELELELVLELEDFDEVLTCLLDLLELAVV
jgi:hypothetical protein